MSMVFTTFRKCFFQGYLFFARKFSIFICYHDCYKKRYVCTKQLLGAPLSNFSHWLQKYELYLLCAGLIMVPSAGRKKAKHKLYIEPYKNPRSTSRTYHIYRNHHRLLFCHCFFFVEHIFLCCLKIHMYNKDVRRYHKSKKTKKKRIFFYE